MASKTSRETETRQALQDLADNEVLRTAKDAIGELEKEEDTFWGSVKQFIAWLRTTVGT